MTQTGRGKRQERNSKSITDPTIWSLMGLFLNKINDTVVNFPTLSWKCKNMTIPKKIDMIELQYVILTRKTGE